MVCRSESCSAIFRCMSFFRRATSDRGIADAPERLPEGEPRPVQLLRHVHAESLWSDAMSDVQRAPMRAALSASCWEFSSSGLDFDRGKGEYAVGQAA